VPETYLSI